MDRIDLNKYLKWRLPVKSLILSFALLLSIQSVFAKTLVITDLDDTVKVTDVLNKKNAIYNALFSKAAFAGMAELYRGFDNKNTIFYYVSGSPAFLEEKVGGFLSFNNFPMRENVVLKKGLRSPTYDYKVAAIHKIMDAVNPDKVILIGDDTEHDPEIYQAISILYPTKVAAIYIRAIKNRELPKLDMIKNFFSAVEVAGWEVLNKSISSRILVKVANSYLNRENGSKVSIKNRYCPSEGRAALLELKQTMMDQSSIDSLELVQQDIIKSCKI